MKQPTALQLNSRRRCPRGQFFRKYLGGEFNGRTESVPMFVREPKLKTIVQKPLWDGLKLIANNSYRLAEPAQKPTNGATYIYEAL